MARSSYTKSSDTHAGSEHGPWQVCALHACGCVLLTVAFFLALNFLIESFLIGSFLLRRPPPPSLPILSMCCLAVRVSAHSVRWRFDLAAAAFNAKAFVLDGEEGKDPDSEDTESDHEEDEQKDKLDIMKERQFGVRKSARRRTAANTFGFQINSSQIAVTSNSEA